MIEIMIKNLFKLIRFEFKTFSSETVVRLDISKCTQELYTHRNVKKTTIHFEANTI